MNDLFQKIFPRRKLQFSPVQEDDDLISVDMQNDTARYENNWDLHEKIDPEKLDAFWDEAIKELGASKPEDS